MRVRRVYSLCACFAYTVSRARVCVFLPVPRSYGNVFPCLHLTLQLANQTHLCVVFFYEPVVIAPFFLHFSPFLSSPLSCLILLATCSVKLLCAPIMGNLYVYRYGSFLRVSTHALKTLKAFFFLFFPVCVPHLSLLLYATVSRLWAKEEEKKKRDKQRWRGPPCLSTRVINFPLIRNVDQHVCICWPQCTSMKALIWTAIGMSITRSERSWSLTQTE